MFRSPQLRCDLSCLSVNAGESQFTQSLKVRDLGVTFDQFLNFDDQFNSRNIGKIRNWLSYNACSTIIHALIICRLYNYKTCTYSLLRVIPCIIMVWNTAHNFKKIYKIIVEILWSPFLNTRIFPLFCKRRFNIIYHTPHSRRHNQTSPNPNTSMDVTLSQHTHLTHKQMYTHHSQRNYHTHNIGMQYNLKDRPNTTRWLPTRHKNTYPAVISSYCSINGMKNKLHELKLLIHETHAYIITIQDNNLSPKAKTP